jgi:putative ABC transport system permease protein
VLGVILAAVVTRYLIALAPTSLPGSPGSMMNPIVLTFTLLIASVAAIVFGLIPAVRKSQTHEAASSRNRGPHPGCKSRVARTLLVAELALSLVLLVGAGLMLRSFARLQTVRSGFDPNGLLTFNLTFPDNSGGPAARAQFMSRLQDRIRSFTGVSHVGLTGGLPLSGMVWTQPYGFEGQPVERWSQNEANFRVITSEYLQAMGTRLLVGRYFTDEEDVLEHDRIVIVDEQLAKRIAPNGNPVGRTIGIPLDGAPVNAQIVGVVESVRHESLRLAGRETIYVPYRQEASRSIGVAVRTTWEPSQLDVPIQRQLKELSAGAPIAAFNFRSMEEYVREALAPTRFSLVLISAFSIIAVIMTLAGVYGVFSYSVSRRVHEIGIRMALGAGHRRVVRDIMASGLSLITMGIGIGWLLALLVSRSLAALVFGVETTDMLTYGSVGLLLALVSLAACYLPARRATRISPLSALRSE